MGEELAIDLSEGGAADSWVFPDSSARIDEGEIVLDGREAMSRVFYQPMEWSDVTLRARFFVEPGRVSPSSRVRQALAIHLLPKFRWSNSCNAPST